MNKRKIFGHLCIRLGIDFYCPKCQGSNIIKSGLTIKKKQRYFCKECKKRFVKEYVYKAYNPSLNKKIITLTKEGLGIRSTARILKISTTTLMKRIIMISKSIKQTAISTGKSYEVDEMRIFIGSKKRMRWIVYALDRENKSVVSFNIGRRTNSTLKKVIQTLEQSRAKKIYTDKLKNYLYIIDKKLHCSKQRSTNHIERHNLTLRTHLKRLNRKTICFSRSTLMLFSIMKIYFWAEN